MTTTKEQAVAVRGLRKTYKKVTALDGIDLDVPAGTVTGLLGPNGAGKTTTVAILSTAVLPDAGRATVCGLDVVSQPAAVRSVIGLAGQYAAVDPNLTGRENLMLIGRLSRLPRRGVTKRANELLEWFNLSDAGSRLVRTYSGGMRRRLDLAAALVHRPPVVLLDEPTASLDPGSRVQLWEMVRELTREGTTVLLTTQYLEEADALADGVVLIDKGRVIAEGTPQQLKERFGSVVAELGFGAEADAVQAEDRLRELSLSVERAGATTRLTSARGSAVVVDAIRALGTDIAGPVSVEIHKPTLDDVFLGLTGQAPDPVTSPR